MDHKTSQCILFKDLVQNALKDDRLKFTEKQKLRPEEDVEMKFEALFVKPLDIKMVNIINEVGVKDNYEDQATKVYPKDEEELVDFLNCCRLKYLEVMLYHRWSYLFDKQAAQEMERINPYQDKKFVQKDKHK